MAGKTDHEDGSTSGVGVNSNDARGDDERSADRRDDRSLAQALSRALADLGVEPELAADIVDDLKSLMPKRHQMSRGSDVRKRLTALLERDQKARPSLLFGSTGANLDIEFEGHLRSQERLIEQFQTDEELLRAYVANERLRASAERQLAVHDGIRSILVAELARRYTLAEQWRYKMPQFMDPVIAVLQAAGIRRDALRPGNDTLLDKIITLVADHTKRENGRDELEEAARIAFGRFHISDDEPPPVDRSLPPIYTPEKLDPWPIS